jgi:hypothetical protein
MGGMPTVDVDVPISAVLLAFFVASAVLHMTIFQKNRRREHKFIPSVMLFGLSMARITTLTMRIVWATRPNNVSVAIAAGVFTAAGVVLLFIINIIFAQRILRAYQPKLGWNKAVTLTFRFLLFCIAGLLIMVITATVLSFYTTNMDTLQKVRDIQLFASTYLALLAFIPIPVVLVAVLLPRSETPENFGQGRLQTKIAILLFTSVLLSFGAGFRVGAAFDSRPINAAAWYHHRAAYYTVNFVIEIICIYTYGLTRFDRLFWVPNGSSKPGDYSSVGIDRKGSISDRSNGEQDVLGYDSNRLPTSSQEAEREKQWEAKARDELERERAGEVV